MHSFQFHRQQEKDIEQAIQYRRRVVIKQQLIYTVVLVVILLLVGLWAYDKVVYTDFDGYVKTDVNLQRAPDDIFVKEIYVQVGDYVVPGDTLFSFISLKPLLSENDWNSESEVVARSREIILKVASVREEVQVLRVRIAELQKQIATEDHNISYGLSSNSHKLDLERELAAARESLRMKTQSLALLRQVGDSISTDMEPIVGYYVARDSAIVSNVSCSESTCKFRTEEIMALLPVNMAKSNFSVLAYVPEDKVARIKRDRSVTVYFNDDFKAVGRFGLIGSRTEDMPSYLLSNFMRQGKVLVVNIDIDDGQKLPFWAFANELPVRIRVPNVKLFAKKEPLENVFKMWISTGSGLTPSSQQYLDSIRINSHKRHKAQRATRKQ